MRVSTRASTASEYAARIERVCLHMESHLSEPLSLDDLARVACLSPYHFHRVFKGFTGETLSCRLRRLCLDRAALLLRHSSRPVAEIALASGYESHAAFTRAFQRRFGEPPERWRTTHAPGIEEAPTPSPKPIEPVRVEQRAAARLVCLRKHGPYAESAPAAWRELMGTLRWRLLLQAPVDLLGICHDDPEITEPSLVRYDACLRLRRTIAVPRNLAQAELPAGRVAVFEHRGPHVRLPETYDRIFGAWLPASPEQLAEFPPYEVCLLYTSDLSLIHI